MRLSEVETMSDFRDLLKELATHQRLFYGPLFIVFDVLYDQYKWTVRLALIIGIVIGMVFGICLPI